jgi:hypothetical protein
MLVLSSLFGNDFLCFQNKSARPAAPGTTTSALDAPTRVRTPRASARASPRRPLASRRPARREDPRARLSFAGSNRSESHLARPRLTVD